MYGSHESENTSFYLKRLDVSLLRLRFLSPIITL